MRNEAQVLVHTLLLATFAFASTGCELIAAVDRDKLQDDQPSVDAGVGGAGATGGAGGTGGTGGSGGVGGTAGTGGTGGTSPECTTPSDCEPLGNECVVLTCDDGICGTQNVIAGTGVSQQTPGDCRISQCDGNGAVESVPDDTDLPDDNNACTEDSCGSGVPVHTNAAEGTSCGTDLVCDGNGACVGCVGAEDCPGEDNDCQARTCDAGACGFVFAPAGTEVATQVPGDCMKVQCDGAGGTSEVEDNLDVPDDGNDCTDNLCQAGVPSNPDKAQGVVCSGGYCDGGGVCAECLTASHCGTDTECRQYACTAQGCAVIDTADGTSLASQTEGDCRQVQCDGAGATKSAVDDTDLPDDDNPCTKNVCTNGVPSHPPEDVGTECGTNMTCDGSGQCVGCVTASDCQGTDTFCRTRTCTSGTCGFDFTDDGTALPAGEQVAGDCKQVQCDGAGQTKTVNFDADVPNDGKECTTGVCTSGVPSNVAKETGTSCTQNDGAYCNVNGDCVECLQSTQCPGTDSFCAVRSCSSGSCGFVYTADGTPLTSGQTSRDCQVVQCDGEGNEETVPDDLDLPVDNNECTLDVCTNGVPSNPNVDSGESCGTNQYCDGNGACVGCVVPGNCPGIDDFCGARTCVSGVCGFDYTAQGTPTPSQTPNDCKRVECDGNGGTQVVNDDLDILDDGNDCTINACSDGTPTVVNADARTVCDDGAGATLCDGNGNCVECTLGTDCPELVCVSNACADGTCNDGVENQDETDVDCGGSTCDPCAPSKKCELDTDCQTGVCESNVCQFTQVVSTSPADGATDVSVDATIAVEFSAAMNPSTLTAQASGGVCSGSVQVSSDDFSSCIPFAGAPTMSGGDTVATFVPLAALSHGQTYKVRVTTAALDATGNSLEGTFTLANGFQTAQVETVTECLSGSVVISQVYGGGGNSGAVYKNDFIELHNRGVFPVDLSTWSVQYASATGTSWQVTSLTGSIAPGGYYLVQQAAGSGGTMDLPTPDATGTIGMSGTAGKVALVRASTTALTGACPIGSHIADFVGFGSASCSETNPTPTLSNTTAAHRNDNGCTDTNNNAADFTVAAPLPRNSAFPVAACPCSVTDTGLPYEVDFCNIQYPASTSVAVGVASEPIYGRLYEEGVTAPAGAPAGILAQLGWGPESVNPSVQSGFQYVDATYNVQVGNDDEFQATITPAASGTYKYVYRFSLDSGSHWTYCDLDGAGSNGGLGFDVSQLGTLEVP